MAASTESRLPSRTRSTSVRCGASAATAPYANASRPVATIARNPRARKCGLDNVHPDICIVGLIAFGEVIEESGRVFEGAAGVIQHAKAQHVLGAVALGGEPGGHVIDLEHDGVL